MASITKDGIPSHLNSSLTISGDLELRPQGSDIRLYHAYTDGSNYERLEIFWNSDVARILVTAAGTGDTTRDLLIGTQGTGDLFLRTNNTNQWRVFGASGALAPNLTDSVDIGTTSRGVKNYFGTGYIQQTEMAAPAGVANTGRIFCEDNGSGKTRLMVQFGTGAAQQIAIEP